MMERVKPAVWAARLVLRKRGYAGTPVDRFVTGVVAGVARSLGLVDKVCSRLWPSECRDPGARAILRLLVYASLVDDRMRAEAREQVTRILESMARARGINLEPLYKTGGQLFDPIESRWRVSRWIYEGLVRWWGRETVEKLLEAMLRGRSIHWLRVNTLRARNPERIVSMLLREGRERARPSSIVRLMVAWRGSLPGRVTALLDKGVLVAQDESAAVAPYLLAPRRDEKILDACAAPGGKTSLLHELGAALIASIEVSVPRAASMLERLYRLGARMGDVVVADAVSPPLRAVFDAILLDPPCTSTGVLDKSPDARWQEPESLERLSRLQYSLLESLWRLLKPGGRLLYTTCSLFPEENELLIKRFLEEHSDAELVPLEEPYTESPVLPGTRRAWPHLHETGGMFYALLVKNQSDTPG